MFQMVLDDWALIPSLANLVKAKNNDDENDFLRPGVNFIKLLFRNLRMFIVS